MRYFLRQTWRNVMTSWGIALQATVVMSIAFLLLGAFGLLALQVEVVLQHWEQEAPVILYLKDPPAAALAIPAKKSPNKPAAKPLPSASTTSVQRKLLAKLRSFQEVRGVRLVTPLQAMQRMKRALGKKGKLLDGMDTPILPTTIELDLKPWARTPRALKQIKATLVKLEGVQEVDVGQRWFLPLWDLVRWVRIILFGGSALLLFAACLIAAGTIRLALFVHRDEIGIMRLLGATETFIRLPFFLEGALKGVFAAGLALGIIYPIFLSIESQYGASFLAFTSIPMRFFQPTHIGMLLLGGLVSGCVGGWLAFFASPATTHDSPS